MYVYFYSLHVSDSHVSIIRRINCINTTSGICHSVLMIVWCAGLDDTAEQTCTTNDHLYRVTYTRCRIDTINSPDDWHMVVRNMFISILYMFRAVMRPSSRELIVSIRHPVYVTLYWWPFGVQVLIRLFCSLIQTCKLNGHLYRATYTGCRIDTINSPDDGHMAARNM
jgi:hypothetical protein